MRFLGGAAAAIVLMAAGAALAQEAPPPPPRAVALEIDLKLDVTRGLLEESAAVTIEGSGNHVVRFRLDEGLIVEGITTSRGIVEHRKAGSRFEVVVEPPLDGKRTLKFRITGRPKRDGMALFRSDWLALGVEDPWYPRLDDTLATTRVTVRAPVGWVAVAPGERLPDTPAGTWTWTTKAPVRGLAVAAAPELKLTDDSAVQVPIHVAAPRGAMDAAAVAARVREAIAWFGGSFAPYPFDALNVVFIPKCPLRLEGAGFVAVPADTPLLQPADGADLVAGQWFGQRLAGDGRWMESFAAWGACIFAKDRGLPLPASIARLREKYFELLSGDVALARAGTDTPQEVIRGKGSAAPDMIRLVTGDRVFLQGIRSLFDEPAGPPIPLRRVRQAIEASAGRDLQRPFEDWFERAGAPSFQVVVRAMPASEGGWRTDLTLLQTRGIYVLPVEVVFLGVGQEHREVLEVDQERFSPFYVLPFETVRVEVDPNKKIFRWP